MKDNNTKQIENILVKNLVRIFMTYGVEDKNNANNFLTQCEVVRLGLWHGNAFMFSQTLETILKDRHKDHKWGLFTPTFVEGTLTLLKAYAKKHNSFGTRGKVCLVPTKDPRNENIFKELDYAKAAIKRLYQFGKTNIRYSLIEEYGEDRVRKDLRKVVPYARLEILTEDHEPDQIRDWLYDEGVTKMTVMYPFMPFVIISIDD